MENECMPASSFSTKAKNMATEHVRNTLEATPDGVVCNEREGQGLFGLSGRLTIHPVYQTNYFYVYGKCYVAVIDSLLKGTPNGK